MRFMVLMIPANTCCEHGKLPTAEAIATMSKYNEMLAEAGILLELDGLHGTLKGARVKFGDGAPTVTDGPFAETKEIVGGFWMWQVKSKEEAVEWAKKCPAAEGDVLEIRQVFEPSEFDIDLTEKKSSLLKKAAA